jgi:cyclopropane-fatty-acyl-phospholipid synthase
VPASQAFSSQAGTQASLAFDRWLLLGIQQRLAPSPISLVLWDGYELPSTAGPPLATVTIRNRRALLSVIWNTELNFGDAYMFGAIEVRGSLVAVLEHAYRAGSKLRPGPRWQRALSINSLRRAQDNVHHHYDLGNDFYKLWLDQNLVYTCAYFPTQESTLEDAQIAKMDLICRKLRLRSGDRVIEAGCGWGALALFMAERYGATVRAFNLSTEQVSYARERAAALGLADRVEFVRDDYRNVGGECDVFVSVGMLEHVGVADYESLGRVIDRVLTPEGRGLLHFIGRNRPIPMNGWIDKRIFPGAYPPTLREVFEHVFEPVAFSVLDVENIRLHYAVTLEHWHRRFEQAFDRVVAMFDEAFARAWRLYLTGSQAAFTTGALQLFQVVFARDSNNAIPWTRGA